MIKLNLDKRSDAKKLRFVDGTITDMNLVYTQFDISMGYRDTVMDQIREQIPQEVIDECTIAVAVKEVMNSNRFLVRMDGITWAHSAAKPMPINVNHNDLDMIGGEPPVVGTTRFIAPVIVPTADANGVVSNVSGFAVGWTWGTSPMCQLFKLAVQERRITEVSMQGLVTDADNDIDLITETDDNDNEVVVGADIKRCVVNKLSLITADGAIRGADIIAASAISEADKRDFLARLEARKNASASEDSGSEKASPEDQKQDEDVVAVKPTPEESEDDFMSRCMGDDGMNSEYPDEDQRYAVCQVYWGEKNEDESEKSEEENPIAAVKDSGEESPQDEAQADPESPQEDDTMDLTPVMEMLEVMRQSLESVEDRLDEIAAHLAIDPEAPSEPDQEPQKTDAPAIAITESDAEKIKALFNKYKGEK